MNIITFENIQGFDRLFRTPEKAGEEYSFKYDFDKENDKISSNNMAIMGMPGTGKTTLALHMAAAIQADSTPSSVLYYSLEQPIEVQAQRLREIDSNICIIENVYTDKDELKKETTEKTIHTFQMYLQDKKNKKDISILNKKNRLINECESLLNELEESDMRRNKITIIKNKITLISSDESISNKKTIQNFQQELQSIKNDIDDTLEKKIGRLENELNEFNYTIRNESCPSPCLLSKPNLQNVIFHPNFVFFPSLSPLPLIHHADEEGQEQNIFWQRFEELKDTIKKIKEMEITSFTDSTKKQKIPPLRMVVIDSLSMFADFSLSRYLVDQLFQLFAEEKVIGLFVLETNREPNLENARALSTENANVTASADVVISLTWQEVDNYSFRQINFLKSRVSPNAYGNHLLKLWSPKGGCRVYPALHAWHPMLVNFRKDQKITPPTPNNYNNAVHVFLNRYYHFNKCLKSPLFGDDVFQHPQSMREFPQILIYGPRHTQKMALAARYAAYMPQDLLTDKHKDKKKLKFLMVSFGVSAIYSHPDDHYHFDVGEKISFGNGTLSSTKGIVKKIATCNNTSDHKQESFDGYLLEFHPGFILPEELMWHIDKTIEKLETDENCKIVKLLFVNISSWRVSYPLLYKNVEKGHDNFFSIVAQYIQWREMSCLYVLASDEKEKEGADAAASSDKLVSTLRSFAHLTIKVDYFDQRGEKDPYSPYPFLYWDNRIFRLTVTGHPVVGKVILHCPVSAFEGGNGWDELH